LSHLFEGGLAVAALGERRRERRYSRPPNSPPRRFGGALGLLVAEGAALGAGFTRDLAFSLVAGAVRFGLRAAGAVVVLAGATEVAGAVVGSGSGSGVGAMSASLGAIAVDSAVVSAAGVAPTVLLSMMLGSGGASCATMLYTPSPHYEEEKDQLKIDQAAFKAGTKALAGFSKLCSKFVPDHCAVAKEKKLDRTECRDATWCTKNPEHCPAFKAK